MFVSSSLRSGAPAVLLIFGGAFSVVVAASGGIGILLLFAMISIKIQRLEYGRYNRPPAI
ncbi:hypothetical protein F0169_10405 [Pseudomonas sp. MAFF 212408]|uniref:Uncharacterized protein n=1 Tax=Pseudomonas kitaguniensis TaxID=2607908 RepID=A0A5N7KK57_9PSED|nr:hypothetical protein [Pseudomonas kitaguniensis]